MYKGKFTKDLPRKVQGRKRTGIVVLSLLFLLSLTIGGTLAYIVTHTEGIVNTFVTSYVDNEVEEKFDGKVKTDVKIKNTGNIDAYIRANVIAYWAIPQTDSNGKTIYMPYGGETPEPGIHYTIEWTMDGWQKNVEDNYYYYRTAVQKNQTTGELFTNCKPVDGKTPADCVLVVEVLGESIQSVPANAVEEAWGMVVNTDGTLSIPTTAG